MIDVFSKSQAKRLSAQGVYPAWICSSCGAEHGRVMPVFATFHEPDPKDTHDKCGWCRRNDVPLTEPRDYGYPPWRSK